MLTVESIHFLKPEPEVKYSPLHTLYKKTFINLHLIIFSR